MKAVIWLRVAAGLALLHDVMHTIGGVFGSAAPGAQQAAVTAMKLNRFVAMGVSRTYWDYFFGYGLFVTVYFAVQMVVLWQLGTIVKTHAALARPVIAALCLSNVATAVIAGKYFFAGPMVMELVMAGCLGVAWVLAGRQERVA